MKPYWVKTHWLIKKLFSRFVWDMPNSDRKVYLTFDDGPTPEITPWVLQVLAEHNIKATFFCIGNNIDKHPEIFQQVITAGHAIGNHTYNHVNGWHTEYEKYLENTTSAEERIETHCPGFKENKLFRPPYGRMSAKQAVALKKQGYKIIMWDVLSADFDQTITPQQCLLNVTGTTVQGSIIIFHDSVKAHVNLRYALPRAIEHLKEKGFRFDVIA